jgi:hypothetical protein
MTGGERLCAALAFSCMVHWGALYLLAAVDSAEPSGGAAAIRLEALGVDAAATAGGAGISMEAAPSPSERADTADKRRQAFFAYLEDLEAAVHAHRLDGGEQGLIGVAVFAFSVRPDGSFSVPALRQTSGAAVLDAAARRAILAVSGTVKRPPVLGDGDIPVVLDVKYQYDLR